MSVLASLSLFTTVASAIVVAVFTWRQRRSGLYVDSFSIAITAVFWGPFFLLGLVAAAVAVLIAFIAGFKTRLSMSAVFLLVGAVFAIIGFFCYMSTFPAHRGAPGGF